MTSSVHWAYTDPCLALPSSKASSQHDCIRKATAISSISAILFMWQMPQASKGIKKVRLNTVLNSNCIYYNSHLSPYHSSHNTSTGGYCKRKDQYSWLIFILTQNTAVAISPILAASVMECIRTKLSLQFDPKETLLWTEMDNQIATQN
jgi:hypothetical protein